MQFCEIGKAIWFLNNNEIVTGDKLFILYRLNAILFHYVEECMSYNSLQFNTNFQVPLTIEIPSSRKHFYQQKKKYFDILILSCWSLVYYILWLGSVFVCIVKFHQYWTWKWIIFLIIDIILIYLSELNLNPTECKYYYY